MAPLRAMGSMLGMQIFGAGTTFLVVLVMTGALGPEGYGRYVWVVSIGGVGALLLQRGLPTTIVQRLSPLNLSALVPPSAIANTFALYTLISIVAMVLAALLSLVGFARPEIVWVLPVAASLASLAVSDAILRAAERGVRAQFASQVVRSGGLLLATFLLSLAGSSNPEVYLALYVISAVGASMMYTGQLLKLAAQDWQGGGQISSSSTHFQVSLSGSIGNHLPIFVTGFFVAPEMLAYLAIAVRLTGPILFGVTASRAHFGARINRNIKAADLEAVLRDYRSSRLYSTGVAILASVGVMGLVAIMTQVSSGPFAEYTDVHLLLTVFALVTIARLALASYGPVQLVALLLGADRFVRKINVLMLSILTIGLTVAGSLDQIWLSAIVMIIYYVVLGSGLSLKVKSLFKASSTHPKKL